MDSISNFISNLSLTCKSNAMIREDGKSLNLSKKISDFFHGKRSHDHFSSVCEKLSQESTIELMKNLSPDKKIEILGRLRQIQKKIKNKGIKNKCDYNIRQFESIILGKNQAKQYSKLIFDEIINNSKIKDKKKTDVSLKKLEAIVDYYAKDEKAWGKIVSKWSDFHRQTLNNLTKDSSFKYQVSVNSRIIKNLLEKEEKILQSKNKLSQPYKLSKVHYENYPTLFRLHLETEFKKLNHHEISDRLSILKNLMDKHSDQPKFIQNCLHQIDLFLGNTVFLSTEPLSLSEKSKKDFLVFNDFFEMVDKHIATLKDDKLKLNLKVKFANLPCPRKRTHFQHLFLNEKNQLNILIDGFQRNENEKIELLVTFLKNNNPPSKDIPRLTKMVSIKSNLSKENRSKLKEILAFRLKDQSPKDWEDYISVKKQLESIFLLKPGTTDLIDSLKRISKGKVYFQNQSKLPEEMILIPRWYHATSQEGIKGIIRSGKIEVRHEKAFRGAWVSTQREGFGPYVLSLSSKITQLDPSVFIGYEYDNRRWRGIQQAIPLKRKLNIPHLALVGVPSQIDETAKKVDKLKLIEILKEQGFPNPRAFSSQQLDFIQKEIMRLIGTPNLPNKWWGK